MMPAVVMFSSLPGGFREGGNFFRRERAQVLQLVAIFFQGMAADEETKNFFLVGQPGVFVPVRSIGQLAV